MRPIDEDIKPVWDQLTPEEQSWYRDFVRGTKYGDKKCLERIFMNISDELRDKIMRELHYEWKARDRNTYTIPKSRVPRYTEWDYNWAQPSKNFNKRREIDGEYQNTPTEDNMRWAR